jgi:hypothetical protein
VISFGSRLRWFDHRCSNDLAAFEIAMRQHDVVKRICASGTHVQNPIAGGGEQVGGARFELFSASCDLSGGCPFGLSHER